MLAVLQHAWTPAPRAGEAPTAEASGDVTGALSLGAGERGGGTFAAVDARALFALQDVAGVEGGADVDEDADADADAVTVRLADGSAHRLRLDGAAQAAAARALLLGGNVAAAAPPRHEERPPAVAHLDVWCDASQVVQTFDGAAADGHRASVVGQDGALRRLGGAALGDRHVSHARGLMWTGGAGVGVGDYDVERGALVQRWEDVHCGGLVRADVQLVAGVGGRGGRANREVDTVDARAAGRAATAALPMRGAASAVTCPRTDEEGTVLVLTAFGAAEVRGGRLVSGGDHTVQAPPELHRREGARFYDQVVALSYLPARAHKHPAMLLFVGREASAVVDAAAATRPWRWGAAPPPEPGERDAVIRAPERWAVAGGVLFEDAATGEPLVKLVNEDGRWAVWRASEPSRPFHVASAPGERTQAVAVHPQDPAYLIVAPAGADPRYVAPHEISIAAPRELGR